MSMKVLYILRHGKSRPARAGEDDHDRGLTDRGHRQAARMGEEFARRGWHPERVLISSAQRTRETGTDFARGYARAGGGTSAVEIDPSLYLAAPDRVLDALTALPPSATSALVIGHNPGLHELAMALAGRDDGPARQRLAAKFPTRALAVVELDIADWSEIRPGRARLVDVVFAKDLD